MIMNSIKPVRQTFGIVDQKTKKLFSDILDYSLVTAFYSDVKLLKNSCHVDERDGTVYLIHIDSRLRNELINKGLTKVIVSLQKRTTGNFAEARIFKEKEQNNEPVNS